MKSTPINRFLGLFLLLVCCFTTPLIAQPLISSLEKPTTSKQQRDTPKNYIAKVMMHDDLTIYYIMPTKEVMGYDEQGDLMLIGYQQAPPKGRTEFKYMLTILDPAIMYAVDYYGHVWQKRHPFKEIVGVVETKK